MKKLRVSGAVILVLALLVPVCASCVFAESVSVFYDGIEYVSYRNGQPFWEEWYDVDVFYQKDYVEFYYDIISGGAVILDCGIFSGEHPSSEPDADYRTDLVIPETLDGYPVAGFTRSSSIFFEQTHISSLTLPGCFTDLGETYLYTCPNIEWFFVDEDNEAFSSRDGILFNHDQTELILFPKAVEGAYEIPEQVTEFGYGAFTGSRLSSVRIPEHIDFSRCDFSGCKNLVSINIPPCSQRICEYSFGDCTSLPKIKIPASVNAIGSGAFSNCFGLKDVIIYGSPEFDGSAFEYSPETALPDGNVYTGRILVDPALGPDFEPQSEYDGMLTLLDFTLYGYEGTSVEAFADLYGYPFTAILSGMRTGIRRSVFPIWPYSPKRSPAGRSMISTTSMRIATRTRASPWRILRFLRKRSPAGTWF